MKLYRILSRAVLAGSPLLAPPALAQASDLGWSGEGAFSAGFTTGNTETRDAGVRILAKHKGQLWTQSGEFHADYGETDEVESKNRLAAAGQLDRLFSEQWKDTRASPGSGTSFQASRTGTLRAWALRSRRSRRTRRNGRSKADPATRSTKSARH